MNFLKQAIPTNFRPVVLSRPNAAQKAKARAHLNQLMREAESPADQHDLNDLWDSFLAGEFPFAEFMEMSAQPSDFFSKQAIPTPKRPSGAQKTKARERLNRLMMQAESPADQHDLNDLWDSFIEGEMSFDEFMRMTSDSHPNRDVSTILPAPLRKKINTELASRSSGLDGNTPWRKAQDGYAAALEILSRHGIQMDEIVNNYQFERGLSGTVRVGIAYSTEDPFSPRTIENSMLILSFAPFGNSSLETDRTKMKFEVIAYLS